VEELEMAEAGRQARNGTAGWIARLAGTVLLALLLAYLIGLIGFIQSLEKKAPAALAPADGIVVLTGTPERLSEAMGLLDSGKAKRLLVSGVNPEVTREELRAALKADQALFDCCVDLDWRAENTIGNAIETATWAQENAMQRLIVVTSAYHLPRALRELQSAMPEAELTGYPVFQDQVRLNDWWAYPGTAKLLVSEYTKYLVSFARTYLAPPVPGA
jgi:uncharacterized SAM-binding protein YcdF (DUF218 family)